MTFSMTAFARQQSEHDWGTLSWEIRSVNHRYLEVGLRLPEALRGLEPKCRDLLRRQLSRGKVDAQLKFVPAAGGNKDLAIDQALLEQLQQASTQIRKVMAESRDPTTLDILKWPGLLQDQNQNTEVIEQACLQLFQSCLDELSEQRRREGEELRQMIEQRLAGIRDILDKLRSEMPAIMQAQRDKLMKSVQELGAELEPGRLEQEVVLLTQKADIDEELDRLDTHVREVGKVITRKEAVGRRLDFLMQELNREANTIGSKAIVTDTTFGAVELKVLIEQMREQIQNIE